MCQVLRNALSNGRSRQATAPRALTQWPLSYRATASCHSQRRAYLKRRLRCRSFRTKRVDRQGNRDLPSSHSSLGLTSPMGKRVLCHNCYSRTYSFTSGGTVATPIGEYCLEEDTYGTTAWGESVYIADLQNSANPWGHLPVESVARPKLLCNALTGETKHHFKWTVSRLHGSWPRVFL